MTTLKDYFQLPLEEQIVIDVRVQSHIWRKLYDGDSIYIARHFAGKEEKLSANLIDHIYKKSDDLVLYVEKKRVIKLRTVKCITISRHA